MFVNSSTGNILYRMNMCLAFVVCGLFMILVGNLCPNKFDMRDISSQDALRAAVTTTVTATAKGATVAAKAAVENKEKLIEMKGKLDQKEALL
jgi:hypothetical protein